MALCMNFYDENKMDHMALNDINALKRLAQQN